jgi:hypothetical protein
LRQPCATEAALSFGELAVSGSENGYAGSVALKSSRRTVFWCDGAASQAESLFACFLNCIQMEQNGKKPINMHLFSIFLLQVFRFGC